MKYIKAILNYYKRKFKNKMYKSLVKRYLITTDPKFLSIFGRHIIEDNNIFPKMDTRRERIKRIMKSLDNDSYRKFFYKSVKYVRKQDQIPKVKPYTHKISMFFSKIYMYFFERELFETLKSFKKWNGTLSKIDAEIRKYITSTTPEERLDRAFEYHIIKKEHRDKLKSEHNYSYDYNDDETIPFYAPQKLKSIIRCDGKLNGVEVDGLGNLKIVELPE